MFKKEKLLSLTIVLLMVIAAAITVNKSLFGHRIEKSVSTATSSSAVSDAITVSNDGMTIIHTANVPGITSGYGGPVPLDIYVADGKITDIKALPNAESLSFFNRASGLFSRWIGKTPNEAEAMKKNG